jgi:heptosyltransferase-1
MNASRFILEIKIKLIQTIYFVINGSLNYLSKLFFTKLPTNKTETFRILVLRNGSIGDCITSFPAIACIKHHFSSSKIDILTNSGSNTFIGMSELLEMTYYNNIVNYFNMGYFNLFKQLRSSNYDIFINLSQDKSNWIREFKLMLFIKSCGIKCAIGFEIGTIQLFLKTQNDYLSHCSEKNRLLNVIKRNGISISTEQFPIKQDNSQLINLLKKIEDKSIDLNKPTVGIVIGGKRLQNQWPIDNWKILNSKLTSLSYNVIVVGGIDDKKNATELLSHSVYSFCGETNIHESIQLIKLCKVVISNDTGPMHLSYALNIPTIGIFSAWQLANIWFPETKNSAFLVDFSLPCSFCYSNRCKDNKCMQLISPELVFKKFTELIDENLLND